MSPSTVDLYTRRACDEVYKSSPLGHIPVGRKATCWKIEATFSSSTGTPLTLGTCGAGRDTSRFTLNDTVHSVEIHMNTSHVFGPSSSTDALERDQTPYLSTPSTTFSPFKFIINILTFQLHQHHFTLSNWRWSFFRGAEATKCCYYAPCKPFTAFL
ncbi:hypothetical protein MJO28_003328 [Puccinia striiformis f. sp. tritici]|uniref:Uncharacterized protein n=1 Tax=Puccinia striiformis f. sp. tritici TaxID=168172 RepID=A0ACC0ESU7_9BASI|nr:hypothetical protein MJO28_003328 [Puccinia striiformis f. sp. tritici]